MVEDVRGFVNAVLDVSVLALSSRFDGRSYSR